MPKDESRRPYSCSAIRCTCCPASAVEGLIDLGGSLDGCLAEVPAERLASYGIEAQHTDLFVVHQLDLNPGLVVAAARAQRAALKKPPVSVEASLDALERQALTQTVSGLRGFAGVI